MRQALLSISALLLAAAALTGPAASQTAGPAAPVPSEAPAAGAESVPGGPATLAAQTGGAEPPARAVAPRSLRPYWHVFAAFAVAWILLLGYVVSLGRRLGRLDDEVRRLGGAAE